MEALLNLTTLHEFLRSRRSVRRFLPEPVPQKILEEIIESANWAPSAHNRQPWRFVVLKTLEAKQRLSGEMAIEFNRDLQADGVSQVEAQRLVDRSRDRIMEAPMVLLLCLDKSLGDKYPDETRQHAEYLMGVQSATLAGGTLLLAAHAEGLGGVWVCAPLFAPGAVRRALDLPEDWEPLGLLLLGYPAAFTKARARRTVADVTVYR